MSGSGEGSNGGNITHPAAVRDPLNTVFALVKLLTIGDSGTRKGLFHLWCSLSGQEEAWRENFTFTDIRRTLPAFTTTSVFEDFAQLKISSKSHGELKKRFRSVFLREWEAGTFPLAADGASWQWKAVSYNGTETTEPGNDFSVSGTGGLKILFSRDAGADEAFIWMRGSGTEPVFRIMADVAGVRRITKKNSDNGWSAWYLRQTAKYGSILLARKDGYRWEYEANYLLPR